MAEVICPELGEGIASATVACWHVKPGQSVKAGDEIVEVVTDKATFCVESPVSGVLKDVIVSTGTEASIGQVLAVIESDE